jgi:long-chain fatty acid transport protein
VTHVSPTRASAKRSPRALGAARPLRREMPRGAALTLGFVTMSAVALAPRPARASGFHIDEQDARATGRAGAVTASTNNPSAIYYNPAGIADLSGVQITVGSALVRPDASFTSAEDGSVTNVNTENILLPQAFVTWRASELVSLGVGFYAPYGLALEWPASSPGRTNIRKADLRTFFISPIFGLNLSRWAPGLSVGGGFDLVPAGVRLDRDILFGTDVATVAFDGSAFGIGGRIGLEYHPPTLAALGFGLSYRSPVALEFSGTADFDAPLVYRGSLPPDGDIETSVTLPQMVTAGVVFSPVPEFELELDVSWRGWSSYDELAVELPDGSVTREAKDWNDSFTLRLGGEYTFDERWSVRAGGVWDQAPVPSNRLDFQVPDANRIDVSVGVGARVTDRLSIDLGGMYVLPAKRSTSMAEPLEPATKGRFEIDVWLLVLSVGVQLDTVMAPPPPDAGMDSASLGHPACGGLRDTPVTAPQTCFE